MSKSLKIMNGVAKVMSEPRKPRVKQPMPDAPESSDEQLKTDPVSETQSPEQENPRMKKPSMKSPKLKMKTG